MKIIISIILTLTIVFSVSAMNLVKAEASSNEFVEQEYTVNQLESCSKLLGRAYKDTDDILEKYIPMYFKGELFPVCIERIYRYYYYDDNDNKIYIEGGTDIYNINGNDYISIRED